MKIKLSISLITVYFPNILDIIYFKQNKNIHNSKIMKYKMLQKIENVRIKSELTKSCLKEKKKKMTDELSLITATVTWSMM